MFQGLTLPVTGGVWKTPDKVRYQTTTLLSALGIRIDILTTEVQGLIAVSA